MIPQRPGQDTPSTDVSYMHNPLMQKNILAQKPSYADHWSEEKSNTTFVLGSPIMLHSLHSGENIIISDHTMHLGSAVYDRSFTYSNIPPIIPSPDSLI